MFKYQVLRLYGCKIDHNSRPTRNTSQFDPQRSDRVEKKKLKFDPGNNVTKKMKIITGED